MAGKTVLAFTDDELRIIRLALIERTRRITHQGRIMPQAASREGYRAEADRSNALLQRII